MITGKKRENTDQEEDWLDYIDEYVDALDTFRGIPYKQSGVFDEIYNIRKFIEFNGKNIIAEEKEFQTLLKEEYDPEEPNHEDIIDKYSHKNSFRKFSYDATLLLIHSRFESRLKDFCLILQKFNKSNGLKIPAEGKDNIGLLETILEDFLSPIFVDLKSKIDENKNARIAFNFLRNKLNHNSGVFTISNSDLNLKLLKEFIAERTDVRLKWISRNRRTKTSTYQVEILKSTLLLEYISLFEKIMTIVAYKANKL